MNLKPIFARIVVISFFLSLWLIPQAVRGQTLYWDLPGGANPSPSGPWDTTSANWSANPNGGGQTTWANGSNAFFSANELAATDNYTITLATNVTVGDLTYTGGNIGASTLQIAVGAGNTITMQNPVMNVAVDGGTILVIAPVIAGAGNLNLTGGTLVLTGANTYIGGTTITTASLQIGNGGTTGSILGDVTDNSNLTFDRSDNITFSSNISGTGNVTQNGTGTVTLTGVNSYSGGTVVFGGIPGAVGGKLSVASDGELGDPAGGITMNGGELLTTTDGFSTARAITVGSTSALSTLAAATGTTATYTGLLSGPGGSLTIGDAINKGTVVFTGNNSYSGITTIFAGVTLQLGIGGTTGSIVGTSITDRGILAFDRSDPITFAVPVSGAALSGSISQIGSGTLTLTGANTYRGGTSVSGNGTISVATDANLGATTGTLGGVTLQSGELLTTGTAFNTARGITLSAALGDDTLAAATGTTATYTGVVSGVGGLTVGDGTNTGTIVLTGTNTYSFGNTLIRAATTLQIGNGGATGSILGNVVDNGTFGFNRTDAVTFSGAVSGTGALSQIGPGTLTLTNVANGYSGGTFVLGGTLSVDTDAELGLTTGGITLQGGELLTTTDGFTTARTVDVSPTGTPNTLAATTGTTATYSGLISDTGALVIGDATHTGTVVFTGNNTYSGGTTITSGTLQLGDGVTNGSITGNVTDNGTFAFNPNGSVTFGGAISGAGNMAKLGAGTVILTANNSYTGTTTISGGTLQIGNGGTSGSIVGNVTDNGNLDFDRSDVVTLPGDTSGTGSLSQTGSGTLILTGANSYNGGTTISAGTLQVGNGGATGSIVGDVTNNGVLVFDRTGTVSFAGAVSGAGTLNQVGPGTLVLTGTSNYAGATTVSAGNLEVDGVLQNTAVSVQTGAVLSGKGTIVGGVTIQNGGHLAPGPGAQTLGVGNLSLSSGSILDYVLSTPGVIGGGVNTLVNVGGNLTLAGILNVTNGGSFGAGTYRLINYTGALSGTTLSLGTLPAGFTEVVTTAVPDQVNLVVSASGGPTQFWNGGTTAGDGTVHGGNGTWDNFTTNFTNAGGTASQSWQNGFAIFSVTPGPVTLGDNILFQRMEFTVSGYTVAGAGSFTLTATGAAVITSDPGVSATISAPIGGVSGLTKSGSGELTLSGTNTYSGGTTVLAGVLSVRSDTNLGNVNGGITLEGGELVTTIDGFTTARTVDVNGSGSPDTLAAAVGTTATYSGVLSDTGALVVGDPTNVGTVVLTGANTYSGGTSLNGGILAVSNDGNLGTGPLNFNGGTLEALTGGGGITSSKAITLFGNGGTFLADAGTQSTFSAAITGNGNFTISGAGELFLTATNNYTGTTTISGATLLIGNGGVTGSIVGNVVDNGTLAFNRSDNITFGGVISGAGVLEQIGPGTLILTGTNSYNGGTMVVNNSVLRVDNDGELGGPAGGITLQGGELETSADFTSARAISTLVPTVAGANILGASVNTTATYSGLISGGGGLVVGGPGDTGTVVLSGANTYTGGTTLSAGATLSVANDGNLGDSSGGLTLNGGELLATGNSFSTARAITVNNGILAAAPGGFAEISGNITVNGGLTIGDAVNSGVVAFSGTNTYGGTTTIVGGATLRADTATGFSPNSAFSVNGTLDLRGSLSQVGSLSGTGLVTNQSGQGAVLTAGSDNSSTTFSGAIQDGGFALGLTKTGSGTLILSGTSTYTGATSVSVGTLQVDGALGNTAVSVESGAVLAGHGTIAGDVTIQNGGHLAPGPVAETLGVRNLVLNQNSILDYVLSTPGVVGGVNTLVNVTGNLTLDGTLNVTNGGSFGAGAYRLLNYTGALTDNTLELGTLPAGFSEVVTTGVPNQVNLVVTSSSVASQFWDGSNTLFDGTVHGGTGTWDNVTTNFTDAGVTVNQAWQGGMAIFSAAGGTVTLGDNIGFHGIQFTIDGYTIVGAGGFTLVPTGTAVISTDAGVSATISASISGTGGLDKAGLGSLTVSGDNTYTGGTTVSGGILSVATDANLGDTTGSLELNGGELLTTGSFTSARTVTLTPGGSPNILAALASTIGTYTGVISGSGGLTVGETIHTGTVVLTNANNSYTGGTTISGTTLSVAVDGNLGDSSGGIALDGGELVATGTGFTTFRPVSLMPNGGVLAAGAAGLADFEGNITGSGNLTIGDVVNTGTVNFSGINSYTGSTTITSGVTLKALSTSAFSSASSFTVSGTLDLNGFNNEVESLSGAGTVTNGGGNAAVFTVGGNGPSTFSGVLQNGASLLGLNKVDPGTLVLTGSNTYTGGTTITAGNLQVGNGGITGSITGNVTDNSAITFSRSDVVTFSGNISGSGSLVQAGAGTLILTGTNVYGGITTIIGGGTLQLGNGGATGSITGNVSDSGSLVFDSSTPLIFGGAIQGPGSVTVMDGLLTLTAGNTYAGGTTINAGTQLQLGNDTPTGSIVGNVVDNGTLSVFRSNDLTLGGNISGSGLLLQSGVGTLTLTGTNTYAGGTRIDGGIVSVDSNAELGVIGAGVGGITLGGGELLTTGVRFSTGRSISLISGTDVVAAENGTVATYTGAISGDNALVVGDATHLGTVVLAGNNTYNGGTIVQGGSLSVAADSNLGAAGGSLTLSRGELKTTADFTTTRSMILSSTAGRDSLFANFGTTATYGGIISGPGELSIAGPGTVVLSGINTYLGGTLTQNGILSVASDLNLGDSSGGILLEAGELLTTMDGFNTARALSIEPSQGNDALAAVTGTTATYAGVLSGAGTLTVGEGADAGTIVLAGDNTYSGGTVINLGTLLVDNAAALGTGDVTVNGGTLGTEVRPINVLGNYTQNAGGTLRLRVAGANVGQYDSLNVVGNAVLGGTLQLVSGFQPMAGQQLGLVSTGRSVSGRFTHFIDPFVVGPDFNTIDLVYSRNSVVLEFLNSTTPISPVVPIVPTTPTTPGTPPVVISTIDFKSFAFSANQGSSATLIDQVELDPRAAGLMGFLFKEPFANLPADFEKISPDQLTSFFEICFSNANIQKLTLEGRLDDIRNGSNGFTSNMNVNGSSTYPEGKEVMDGKSSTGAVEPVLQHAPENRWGVWVTGFGDFVNVDGDGNGKSYDFTTGGVTLGIDYRITDQLAIGAMGDYSHTWTSLNPRGHIDVDSGRGGLYATWYHHGFYLNGAIYGGHDNYDSSRSGLGGLATGGTEGSEWSAFISGGYDFHFGQLTVGPIASLQYTEVHIDGFSEKGSLAPLAIHSDSAESLRSDVGFRTFYTWQIGKIVLEPSLKVAWEHEYKYSALPITAGFAGISGASATFFGPDEGHDSAVVSAGVSVQLTPAISTYVNYDGQLGREHYDSNAVTGGVRISF